MSQRRGKNQFWQREKTGWKDILRVFLSVFVKNSGQRSYEIRKVLTETTLKTFRVRWARKDRARGGYAFLIKKFRIVFQGRNHLERSLVYFSDKLQSKSIKFSRSLSPKIRKVLTETTLKTFSASAEEYPGPRKHFHGSGSIKSIKNSETSFQPGKKVEKKILISAGKTTQMRQDPLRWSSQDARQRELGICFRSDPRWNTHRSHMISHRDR